MREARSKVLSDLSEFRGLAKSRHDGNYAISMTLFSHRDESSHAGSCGMSAPEPLKDTSPSALAFGEPIGA